MAALNLINCCPKSNTWPLRSSRHGALGALFQVRIVLRESISTRRLRPLLSHRLRGEYLSETLDWISFVGYVVVAATGRSTKLLFRAARRFYKISTMRWRRSNSSRQLHACMLSFATLNAGSHLASRTLVSLDFGDVGERKLAPLEVTPTPRRVTPEFRIVVAVIMDDAARGWLCRSYFKFAVECVACCNWEWAKLLISVNRKLKMRCGN